MFAKVTLPGYNERMDLLRFSSLCKRYVLLITVLVGMIPTAILAQSDPDLLPPPHLGYGIHIGPHLPAPPELIQSMGMDWVKVYDAGQVDDYPMLRVLYRMDLDWPNDWDYFRAEVTRRTHELINRGVDAIEIHNEPNLSMEWSRGPNAWEYTQMLRVAYQTIKAIAPDMIVVSGGLAPTMTTPDRMAINDLEFAREMLENGAANYFDVFGYHPYGFNQPPEADPYQHELVFRRTERIRDLLVAYGAGDKPIWLTEYGWLRDPAEQGLNCTGSPALAGFDWMRVSEQTQAEYTVRSFQFADQNWPWVGPMFLWNLNWQQYETDYEDACSHLRWYGILERDGSPTMTFNAVANMPRRYTSYLPQLEARPTSAGGFPIDDPSEPWEFTIAAFCPRLVEVGKFEVVNAGWPASLVVNLEPQNVPAQGMPETLISAEQVNLGDSVTIFADVGNTAPGTYMLAVTMRSTYQGRTLSGSARMTLLVENSPINCQ